MGDNFTFADLVAIQDKICPPLYYATIEECERGRVYYIKGGKFHPEYVVFHPDDFDEIKQNIVGRRLVHLRDYSPINN